MKISDIIYKQGKKIGTEKHIFQSRFFLIFTLKPLHIVAYPSHLTLEPLFVIKITVSTCHITGNNSIMFLAFLITFQKTSFTYGTVHSNSCKLYTSTLSKITLLFLHELMLYQIMVFWYLFVELTNLFLCIPILLLVLLY